MHPILKVSVLLFAILLGGCQSAGPARSTTTAPATRLEEIRLRKEIRIGTTGDYKPFSFQAGERSEFVGVDIDLGRDLAVFLGVQAKFIKTSWPALMKDLADDHFDLALSGVSKTKEREALAYFSDGYSSSGKTPIARCADKDRFNTLEKIDVAGVNVIVNPGGSNEKFARGHFPHAKLTIYPDNRTIFAQIVDQKADVMVTDTEEVALQTKLLPVLCATMPGQEFETREKGVLMPKDPELREAVNKWLGKIRKNGTLAKTFEKHRGEN